MSSVDSFSSTLASLRPEIDAALDRYLPAENVVPQRLHEAMRYSVFAGGKRVRPALVLLAGELYGTSRDRLLPAAAALEMVHTFSLIHDDLPGIDNDDLRRGQPTSHRHYDEATAILAGDALLNQGLNLLAREPSFVLPELRLEAVALMCEAIGTGGMIGGQMEDIESERVMPVDAETVLERIHLRKTGALLRVALRLGGLLSGVSPEEDSKLGVVGDGIGLLFQIADDILDVEGETAALGKTSGKDETASKLTYPRVFGLSRSKELLKETCDRTLRSLTGLPDGGGPLPGFVTFLAARDH